jgi:hypothetical protein
LPLAKELVAPEYDGIAARYPPSRAVIDYVRDRIDGGSTTSLEDALASFATKAEGSFERRAQLIAFRFYLRRLITNRTGVCQGATSGYTHYLKLFNRLHDWQRQSKEPIRIVTFNYDTLIEDALETVVTGWRFTNEGDYIKRPDWTLMKLHGSVTWGRFATYGRTDVTGQNSERAMQLADQLLFEDEQALPFRMWIGMGEEFLPGSVYVPALAVPMANKTRFECPSLHVEALRSCIPQVNRLLICGWRAAESHAIEILDGINPGYYLGVVAGGEPDLDEVLANLGPVGKKGKPCLMRSNGMSGLASDMSQLDFLTERPW